MFPDDNMDTISDADNRVDINLTADDKKDNRPGMALYFFKITFITHVFCFENMKKVNLISEFVRYLTNNAFFYLRYCVSVI